MALRLDAALTVYSPPPLPAGVAAETASRPVRAVQAIDPAGQHQHRQQAQLPVRSAARPAGPAEEAASRAGGTGTAKKLAVPANLVVLSGDSAVSGSAPQITDAGIYSGPYLAQLIAQEILPEEAERVPAHLRAGHSAYRQAAGEEIEIIGPAGAIGLVV